MNFIRVRTGIAGLASGILSAASLVVCFTFAMMCTAAPLPAQDAVQETAQPSGTGQPARAVRLSYVDGQVELSQGGQVLAQKAVVNTPLLEGMQLTTANDGKAEIQFEDGSVARISPDSSLTISELKGSGTGAVADLTVNSGLAYFELQSGYQNGKINVHFGNSVASSSGFTVLRVDMDRGPGKVAVFSGNAHLEGNSGSIDIDLHDGESIALNATDPSHYDMAESIEPDSWDSWNSDRDQLLTSEAAAQTGAPANMGQNTNPAWNDLDANGSWYNVPGQGYIWSPYDAANAGFDPYGFGNWTFTPGYGYVWASGYPWGYMPFQCGAWNFYNSFGWGWAPGMGGCSPWWGMGFYGGPNFGYVPPGYRVIGRPIVPRHPVGAHPLPVVAVNHGMPGARGAFPARAVNKPVVIAGNSVQAMRPLPSRADFNHPTIIVGGTHTGAQPMNNQAGTRPGYSRPAGWTPTQGLNSQSPASPNHNNSGSSLFGRGNSGGNSAGATGARPSNSGGGNSGAHPSGGGGGYSGGGASSGGGHPSGGGGFSGGGGGGGGSGSHGGGGGGGGHH